MRERSPGALASLTCLNRAQLTEAGFSKATPPLPPRIYNEMMLHDPLPLYATADEMWMARCLSLAEGGRTSASPNPMVGCIVLDANGRKVGEGFHAKAGEPHAEVFALDQAGERARGGTLYVNLEPCSHQGRTPPCAQKVIASGIRKVICGTLDPNPQVAGGGRDALQNAGIEVRYGVLEAECRALNTHFFHFITTKTPFITLKLAMTADGKLATRHGESQWVTGAFARQMVHHMRHHHDAVLTTAETVMADDPQLTIRDIPRITRQPVRIVLDRRFRLNVDRYQLFKQSDDPVWIVTSDRNPNPAHALKARQAGVEIIEVPEIGDGLDLKAALRLLGQKRIASLMTEAGGRLSGSLLSGGLAQKLALFYAPNTLPDAMARQAFGSAFQLHLPQVSQFTVDQVRQLDQDWLVEATPIKKGLPRIR